MKKSAKILTVILAVAMIFTMVPATNTHAAANKTRSKVTYTLEKGTLTIKGNGAMPESMIFRNNKKIKKVVIKKGVTSISDYAFDNCKNLKKISIPSTVKSIGYESFCNTAITEIEIPSGVRIIGQGALEDCNNLKKVTMPGNFKIKTKQGDDEWKMITYGSEINTIIFNTQLKIKNVSYLQSYNLIPDSQDKKYTSIDGVIYTKDRKGIVRVPALREKLIINAGCTEFNLQAVLYCSQDYEGDPIGGCTKLESIVIPSSVESINNTKYQGEYTQGLGAYDLTICSEKLDGADISVLYHAYWDDDESALEIIKNQLPQQLTFTNGMYVTDDGVLLKYTGQEKQVKISEEVKIIGERAFDSCYKIKKIEIPATVTTIEEGAFSYCSELAQINIPDSVIKIGDEAFSSCGSLKSVRIPNSVKVMGERILIGSGVETVELPNGMTEIPAGMFYDCQELKSVNIPATVTKINDSAFNGCSLLDIKKILENENIEEIGKYALAGMCWKKITIPSNVKKIGEHAFDKDGVPKKYSHITVQGSTKYFEKGAFPSYKTKVTFQRGIKQAQAALEVNSRDNLSNGISEIAISWTKISGVKGYQIKYATDKKFKKGVGTAYIGNKKDFAKIKIKSDNKKIYVKIRPYKKVDGKKVYGKWSAVQGM